MQVLPQMPVAISHNLNTKDLRILCFELAQYKL